MTNLYKSLASFQQECPIILKATQGYGYVYSDLPAIFEIINPLLKKHGLGFYQAVNNGVIKTVIFHSESGETIESETTMPVDSLIYEDIKKEKNGQPYIISAIKGFEGMNKAQAIGSLITYFRRYALSSLLGLVTDKDTDGAEAHQPTAKPVAKPSAPQGVPICDNCGSFKKLIPAGISKSGNHYEAFYSCPNKCK
jgi:hypothetical protein